MVEIPEEEFGTSIVQTYYTGSDYIDWPGLQDETYAKLGLEDVRIRGAVKELLSPLVGMGESTFYTGLLEALESAPRDVARLTIRLLLYLSSVPVGERRLPLVVDSQVEVFDLQRLAKPASPLAQSELPRYVRLLKALGVGTLFTHPGLDIDLTVLSTAVGSAGNSRKNRSGDLMQAKCDQAMIDLLPRLSSTHDKVVYKSELEVGRLTILSQLRSAGVDTVVESIPDPQVRAITRRELGKSVDGLWEVTDDDRTLSMFCEYSGYFSSGGSKPSEVRRAYSLVADYLPQNTALLWVTDGRLFLDADGPSLNSLGQELVAFNREHRRAMVLTPALLPKYVPRFIDDIQ